MLSHRVAAIGGYMPRCGYGCTGNTLWAKKSAAIGRAVPYRPLKSGRKSQPTHQEPTNPRPLAKQSAVFRPYQAHGAPASLRDADDTDNNRHRKNPRKSAIIRDAEWSRPMAAERIRDAVDLLFFVGGACLSEAEGLVGICPGLRFAPLGVSVIPAPPALRGCWEAVVGSCWLVTIRNQGNRIKIITN